jgi:BAAT / Acyl-CoA thioester hydrolase C terminal
MPNTARDAAGQMTFSTQAIFDSSLEKATAEQIERATIPVERIEGPILLIAGKDDQIWPSCRLASVAFERLVRTGHTKRHDDVSRCLEEAGHLIGVPGGSTMGHAQETMGDLKVLKGGTPSGAARAEHEMRALLLRHFSRALGQEP